MKIKDLAEKLKGYNPEAEVSVVVHCQKEQFSITFGSSDGVTKDNCDSVSFYVDRLCQSEKE